MLLAFLTCLALTCAPAQLPAAESWTVRAEGWRSIGTLTLRQHGRHLSGHLTIGSEAQVVVMTLLGQSMPMRVRFAGGYARG